MRPSVSAYSFSSSSSSSVGNSGSLPRNSFGIMRNGSERRSLRGSWAPSPAGNGTDRNSLTPLTGETTRRRVSYAFEDHGRRNGEGETSLLDKRTTQTAGKGPCLWKEGLVNGNGVIPPRGRIRQKSTTLNSTTAGERAAGEVELRGSNNPSRLPSSVSDFQLFSGRRPRPLSLPPAFDFFGTSTDFGRGQRQIGTGGSPKGLIHSSSQLQRPHQFPSNYTQKFPVSYSTPKLSSFTTDSVLTAATKSVPATAPPPKVTNVNVNWRVEEIEKERNNNGYDVPVIPVKRHSLISSSFTFHGNPLRNEEKTRWDSGGGMSSSKSFSIFGSRSGQAELSNTLPRRGGTRRKEELALFMDIMATQERFVKVRVSTSL